MKKIEFRKLRADEIDVRIGTANEKGVSLLLYKDARVDMNILDESVGQFNWQRDHKELKGNIYCGVSILDTDTNQWITKWDCGKESNTEAEKGESSDSFKRACFNWGIGRELYTSPFIWVSGATKNDRFEVSFISYNEDGTIKELSIMNSKTKEVVFTKGHKEQPKIATPSQIQELVSLGVDIAKACHYFGDIPTSQWDYTKTQELIAKAKERKGVK